jgi:hypothetical protein
VPYEPAWPELWPDTALALARKVAEAFGWRVEVWNDYIGQFWFNVYLFDGEKRIAKEQSNDTEHEAAWAAIAAALDGMEKSE